MTTFDSAVIHSRSQRGELLVDGSSRMSSPESAHADTSRRAPRSPPDVTGLVLLGEADGRLRPTLVGQVSLQPLGGTSGSMERVEPTMLSVLPAIVFPGRDAPQSTAWAALRLEARSSIEAQSRLSMILASQLGIASLKRSFSSSLILRAVSLHSSSAPDFLTRTMPSRTASGSLRSSGEHRMATSRSLSAPSSRRMARTIA